jgi:hypothetical protein
MNSQNIGPKNWPKKLAQKIGPNRPKIGPKNWSKNGIGTKVTQKLKNSKKA